MRISSHLRLFVVASVLVVAHSQAEEIPGWTAPASTRRDFEATLDSKVSRSGKACASIRSLTANPKSVGTLMQSFAADDCRGKRVRLTGYVKTLNVISAQFWLRIDSQSTRTLASDSMDNRPVVGTADWTKCELVLDVPENAASIYIGCMLQGNGKLWFDDVKFEVVGQDVPVTDTPVAKPTVRKAPQNLDFEDLE